ncbi:MAG: hypothetical protein ACK41T_01660 [Pseudobdellovibrio sp.]
MFIKFLASALFIVQLSVGALAKAQEKVTKPPVIDLTVLQNQIKECSINLDHIKKVKNLNDLYKSIDREYLLLSEKTLEREVLYKIRSDTYKLKVLNDVISIYKVGEEDRLEPINIDAKRKSSQVKTVKGQVKQFTLNAKVDEDWAEYFEQRESGYSLEYSIRNSKISALKITNSKNKHVLDCRLKTDAEVCNCLTSEQKKNTQNQPQNSLHESL